MVHRNQLKTTPDLDVETLYILLIKNIQSSRRFIENFYLEQLAMFHSLILYYLTSEIVEQFENFIHKTKIK